MTVSRRKVLMGLATLPVVAVAGVSVFEELSLVSVPAHWVVTGAKLDNWASIYGLKRKALATHTRVQDSAGRTHSTFGGPLSLETDASLRERICNVILENARG